MRAMILAAGRGARMGDLTRTTPKPLLKIGNRYLIEFAIERLKKANILDIVINVSYHAELICKALGDGSQFGVSLHYSVEETPLETGGGICQALPLLGNQPFIVLSADVICDFPLSALSSLSASTLAHLILVPNPIFHPQGDFGLRGNRIDCRTSPFYTFGNIGLYHPDLFASETIRCFPLRDILFPAIDASRVTGQLYEGLFHNIGTSQELSAAQFIF